MAITPVGYRPRLLDSVLDRRLETFAAVEVKGTKFCGKTWTSEAHGESIVHLDDDAVRSMADVDVTLALEGEQPHVIDEWQDLPKVWDAVRRRADESGNRPGEFILTGSSSVDYSAVSHSGAGRIAELFMRPMSLAESGESNGSVSLADLFEGRFAQGAAVSNVRDLARFICRGGWPALVGRGDATPDLAAQYLNALFTVSAEKAGLDGHEARRVAVSLARNMGKTVTYRTLYEDAFGARSEKKTNPSMYQQRVAPFLRFFEQQYFTEDQDGWDAPVKARSRVRTKPKRTFVDPSLPAALLGLSPERLLADGQVFGNLFEELCLRDLRVYASALGCIPDPALRYYADADGLEVDAVLELPDGRWGAFEIKLSEEKAEQGAASLLRLRDKVAANPASRSPEPSFLAVLVGKSTFRRRLPSGVVVVPITCLRP